MSDPDKGEKPTEDRRFRTRGLLYDLARNQRADPDHLERVVRKLAELDFNLMAINLEYRFDFPSCPGVAPLGALTPAMASALVAFGSSLGVEIVAQPNFTGHCEGLCATERLAHLSCDPYQQAPGGGYDQLNLEIPEARELVRAMFSDICAAFPGRYIHIGGDEIRRLEYVFPGDGEAQVEAMQRYLTLLFELAREHGRQVLMWGDMPLKHAKLRKALPKDLIICHWCYEPGGSRDGLETYKSEGFRVLSCPAVRTRRRVFSISTRRARRMDRSGGGGSCVCRTG
jgi:N-acetyl-beta-hexosaminidase